MGDLNIRARVMARQCLSLIHAEQPLDPNNRDGDVRVRVVHRTLAHAHALRAQLRNHMDDRAVQRWLTAQDWDKVRNLALDYRGDAIVQANANDLAHCMREGRIDPINYNKMDETLTFYDVCSGFVRASAPHAHAVSYTLLLHRTAHLYCFLLPFGLVDVTGFMTPFVVAIVAYTFFGLDALGDELEEPLAPTTMTCRWMPCAAAWR